MRIMSCGSGRRRRGAGLERKFVGIIVGILGTFHLNSTDRSVCYDISEVPLLAPWTRSRQAAVHLPIEICRDPKPSTGFLPNVTIGEWATPPCLGSPVPEFN